MNYDNYVGLCNSAKDYIRKLFYGKKTYFDDDVFYLCDVGFSSLNKNNNLKGVMIKLNSQDKSKTVFIREEIQNRNSCFKIDNPILTFLKLTIINHNYKDDVQEFNLFCWSLGEPGDTDSYFTNRDAGLYWKKPILLNQPENDNWI